MRNAIVNKGACSLVRTIILSLVFLNVGLSYAQDSLNVRLVGHCLTRDRAMDVVVQGDYAYVADYDSGLTIIDISEPEFPFIIGHYNVETFSMSVALNDTILFLPDMERNLLVLNIYNPSSPFEISRWDEHLGGLIFLKDDYIYFNSNEIVIIDASNPESLVTDGVCSGHESWSIFADNEYLYVTSCYFATGIFIINVSDPFYPYEIGSCLDDFDEWGDAKDVFVLDSYAYVASGNSSGLSEEFQIIDITNPAFPFIITYYSTYPAKGVYVKGHNAFLATNGGLRIIDISNPYSPYEVGYYQSDFYANSITITDSFAYVTAGNDGFYIFDISYFTGISESETKIPEKLVITAYPNPFNSSCTITLSCHSSRLSGRNPEGWVDVEIYDLRGNVVWRPPSSRHGGTLSPLSRGTDRSASEGQGVYIWTPDKSIASGIYLVRATTNDGRTTTKRIVYIR